MVTCSGGIWSSACLCVPSFNLLLFREPLVFWKNALYGLLRAFIVPQSTLQAPERQNGEFLKVLKTLTCCHQQPLSERLHLHSWGWQWFSAWLTDIRAFVHFSNKLWNVSRQEPSESLQAMASHRNKSKNLLKVWENRSMWAMGTVEPLVCAMI